MCLGLSVSPCVDTCVVSVCKYALLTLLVLSLSDKSAALVCETVRTIRPARYIGRDFAKS